VSFQTRIDFKEGKKKAMKEKMIMRKVLCCLVVIAILMSTMPASVFALGDAVTATTQLRSLQNVQSWVICGILFK
jgi:hypothetical protein